MFDTSLLDMDPGFGPMDARTKGLSPKGPGFRCTKRAVDIVLSLMLLPVLGLCALGLLVLNPLWNRGPLFFVQTRMGRDCQPFQAIKFRSMRPAASVTRAANDPLEIDRITPAGRFIRKARIDELPQLLNVLKGDMSLIGPRPDSYAHAMDYLDVVPGYRARHAVRPGISGLAQTELGYIEGFEATRRKVQADLYYIAHTNLLMEAWIVWRTIAVVATRSGA